MRFVVVWVVASTLACGGTSNPAVFDEPGGGKDAAQGDGATDATTSDDTASDGVVEPDGGPPPIDVAPEVAPPVDGGPVCPAGTIKPPELCPEVCSGGCDKDRCIVRCPLSGCGNRRIDCPPGMRCIVQCGTSACGNADIRCAADAPCEVHCIGTSSCGNVRVRCPTVGGACQTFCSGPSACHGGVVTCGPGACAASCTGFGSALDKLECGASCECSNKC